jgi:hypothetical protein
MTIVIASFILVFISLFIRGRFINESKFNLLLQIHGVSLFLWVIFTFFVIALYSNHIISNVSDNLFLEWCLLLTVSIAICLSWSLSFFMTKGPIDNTYFSNRSTRNIYIDINKDFILPGVVALKSERIEFVKNFTRRVVLLKGIHCKNIIIMSHLITPGISKIISETLKGERAIFTCKTYTLKRSEIITLNLLYGGKTRYRIFSLEKHPNGFKVHKTGRAFTIKNNDR